MSRAKTYKLYNTFVRGLITEASPLTYPENATYDELNCYLTRRGDRGRRLGINTEASGTVSALTFSKAGFDALSVNTYVWQSVANQPDVNYLAVQVGLSVSFFNLGSSAISSGLTSLNIDLTPYVRPGVTSPASKRVSLTSGKGYLFIVGEHIDPIIVTYDRDTNTVSADTILLLIRDFKGVDDGLANDQEPTTLTDLHKYNLMNQGWVNSTNNGTSGSSVTYYTQFGSSSTYVAPDITPINTYHTSQGRYPGNNKQWWSAKNASGVFDPTILVNIFGGNTRAPQGHFILEAFNLDRAAVSGITSIPVETTYERPSAVGFFSGRVWYAVNSTVYFSQYMDDKRKVGFCYQEADPTSEDISDLIATDGGVIPIPEMSKAVALIPAGNGILVFATNGIWNITGTSAGFTATDISVSKVSPIGTDSPNSIIQAEGEFYWWSRVGIMGMSQKVGVFGPIEGSFDRTLISESTIQTLYNDIPFANKAYVSGVYDAANNLVVWLYSSDTSRPYRYDRVLNLDLTLKAFYPYQISSTSSTPWIVGGLATPKLNDISISFDVWPKNSFIKYMSVNPVGSNYNIAFNSFRDSTYQDWGTETYLSFIETGYELLQDAMREKQTPFITTFFKRTEDMFELTVDGDYTMNHQSSCYLMAKWDWSNSPVSNKWSNKRQVYKYDRMPVVDESNLAVDNGYAIITATEKVRGNGRSIQFRFECDEANRDFHILGWAVQFTGNVDV